VLENDLFVPQSVSISGLRATFLNIQAAASVANLIRSTYGPRGKSKLIVHGENVILTNDGATILRQLSLEHPVAQILVNISLAQEREVGDGTTGVVLLASALLNRAWQLLQLRIHPRLLVRGYQMSLDYALSKLSEVEQSTETALSTNEEMLVNVAKTALSSKAVVWNKEHFARLVVRAAQQDAGASKSSSLHVVTVNAGSLLDSTVFQGICFERPFVYAGHALLPKRIERPRILLLNCELELKSQAEHIKFVATSPQQYKDFADTEVSLFFESLQRIVDTGCNVILSTKAIGDFATQFFAEKRMWCAGRVPLKTIQLLSTSLGIKIQSTVEELDKATALGTCDLFEEREMGGKWYEIFTGFARHDVTCVLLCGASQLFTTEAERSFTDAFSAVKQLMKASKILLGGGALEMYLHRCLVQRSLQLTSEDCLIMTSYAEALTELPAALCDNAQLNTAKVMSELREIHEVKSDGWKYGVGILEDGPADMMKAFVWEPSVIKIQALRAATEAVTLILSIDYVLILPRLQSQTEKDLQEAKKQQERKQLQYQQSLHSWRQ
jgi:T-complex protein 1 subunit eta